uniref:Uncharacterized protein n=1 Tax=Knipowitschia caucasica TaxID=637954 RepID=A0AAV2KGS4_KNICA
MHKHNEYLGFLPQYQHAVHMAWPFTAGDTCPSALPMITTENTNNVTCPLTSAECLAGLNLFGSVTVGGVVLPRGCHPGPSLPPD